MNFKTYLEDISYYLEWTHDIRPSDSLHYMLSLTYEWEYKYRQIAGDPKLLTKRKDNMMKLIEGKMAPVFEDIFSCFIHVFGNWIDMHDFRDPALWAKTKFVDLCKPPYDVIDSIQLVYDEYEEAKKNLRQTTTNDQFALEFLQYEWKRLLPIVIEVCEQKNISVSADKLQFANLKTNQSLIANEVVWNAKEYMRQYKKVYLQSCQHFGIVYIFPYWSQYWKAKGVEQTFHKIRELYNELVDYNTFSDFNKTIVMMHRALNMGHQTGSMMDYIADHYDVTKKDLDDFSDKSDLSKWNKELNDMGIFVSAGGK